MMRSMFSGVAGLRNHQTRMDVIGNNIANVNTVGYKTGRVNFQEMLVQTIKGASAPQGGRGGVNAQQIGLGVQVSSIDYIQTQGNLQNTGKMTDLALQGDGFFILSDGSDQLYTRTGSLDLDQDGNLIFSSNGMKVMGWTSVDAFGKIQTNTSMTSITVPIGQSMKPQATESVTYANNLDAGARLGTIHQTQVEVYDSVGNPHTVVLNIEKVSVDADGNTTWRYTNNLGTNDPIIQNFVGIFDTYDSLLPGGPGDPDVGPLDPIETQYQVLQLAQKAGFLNNPDVMLEGKKISGLSKLTDLVDHATDPTLSIRAQVQSFFPNFDTVTDPVLKLLAIEAAYNAVQANKLKPDSPDFFYMPDYSLNTNDNYPYVGTGPASLTMKFPDRDPAVNFDVTLWTGNPVSSQVNATMVAQGGGVFTANFNFGAAVGELNVANMGDVYVAEGLLPDPANMIHQTQWFNDPTASLAETQNYLVALRTAQKQMGIDTLNPRYGSIIFDQSGQLVADMTRTANFIVDPKNINLTRAYSFSPSGAKTVNIIPDFKSITQYVSPFTAGAVKQNGNPAGTLQTFTIDSNGTISGIFSNGFTKDIAVIGVANFNNPGGLLKVGENIFKRSNNSGLAQVGTASTGGRGTITPGTLEMSNVDLSQEFTNMIVTQRGFQANSRIITTSDEMLQELVNLKR